MALLAFCVVVSILCPRNGVVQAGLGVAIGMGTDVACTSSVDDHDANTHIEGGR